MSVNLSVDSYVEEFQGSQPAEVLDGLVCHTRAPAGVEVIGSGKVTDMLQGLLLCFCVLQGSLLTMMLQGTTFHFTAIEHKLPKERQATEMLQAMSQRTVMQLKST
jgi:hypothetical protein